MNTRPIRFFHRGRTVEVCDAPATRTVLEWLREDQRCTGTKEGCAEGDCGACTVVVGTLDAHGGLALQPVNACIQFLPTLDGKALFTVEDLPTAEGLHPVQQQMVACHGSQCGFCTPGIVMSLWACSERHHAAGTRPSRRELADDLSGNLCRCTGYRPILDAGERVFDAPARPLDRGPVTRALQALQVDPPLHYAAPAGVFHAPRTVQALAELRAARPQARLLAGGTDIGLWVTKQFRELGELIYLGSVDELRRIEVEGGALRIGAAVSLEDGWRAVVGHWPALRDVWLRFASRPVREAGTLVGNLANGSPIGDTAPVFIALGARLVLRREAQTRLLPLEAFYVDYMKNRLEPGEFIEAVEVPVQDGATGPSGLVHHARAYKIAKRFDCDISAVCAGLFIGLEGPRVHEVRLAFGGMAAIVRRAPQAEAALRGSIWNEEALRAAQTALGTDFTPLSDLRASAAYRLQVARNLLERFWLETRTDHPLPVSATQVWPHDAEATRDA